MEKEKINDSFQKDLSFNNNIDKYIEQLYECKKLKKQEIIFIIKKSKEIFSQEKNIEEVPCPVTICGDIHGQFLDLLELFRLGGRLPHTNYIFLGNYINNGYNSIETLSLLLCLKVRYPQRICLIRGNHETKNLTLCYGFYDECIRKYGSPEVWKYFIDLFNYLPLGVLIEEKIFCIHSGLSPLFHTLDDIRLLDRTQVIDFSDGIISHLLWNEPGNCIGFTPYCKGAGFMYGERISKEFCRINDLDMIIRSSSSIPNGYSFTHDNKVCSICSCPNYLYRCNNNGAIMEIDEFMKYEFYTFSPAPRGKIELMEKTIKS